MRSNTLVIMILILITTAVFSQDGGYSMKWKNGFKLESADKNFKLKFGGRIMLDNAFFFQDEALEDEYGELNNGAEVRRARFFNSGTLYKNINYKLQVDFAGSKSIVKDLFIGVSGLPIVGNVRVGHMIEPMSLQILTSSKYITFMERSLPNNFLPARNTGILFYNDSKNKRISWQAGLFRRSDKSGNDKKADDGYAITTRITGLPILNKKEKELLHVGASFSYRKPNTKTYKVSVRPSAHLGTKYLDYEFLDVNTITMFNTEASLVINQFSLQSEYFTTNVELNNDAIKNSFSKGFYVQVSYFLTDDSRKYKSSLVGFSIVSPKNNFGSENGYGALEVALRYAEIDLVDNSTALPNQQEDITLGLNWHLNPATRIMANYVIANINSVAKGKASNFQVRFQVDF